MRPLIVIQILRRPFSWFSTLFRRARLEARSPRAGSWRKLLPRGQHQDLVRLREDAEGKRGSAASQGRRRRRIHPESSVRQAGQVAEKSGRCSAEKVRHYRWRYCQCRLVLLPRVLKTGAIVVARFQSFNKVFVFG